jgi:hypothetical protein
MAAPTDRAGEGEDSRIVADPLAPVLVVLAALGSIASIAAVHWVAQDKTPTRSKTRRKAAVALRDLESCCLGLHEICRRLQRHVVLHGGGSGAAARMKFGNNAGRISPEAARHNQQLVNDIASMLVLASQNAYDTMAAIEDGEVLAPETVYFGFGEQQEQLNRLLQERPAPTAAVSAAIQIARKLADLVAELKRYRVD